MSFRLNILMNDVMKKNSFALLRMSLFAVLMSVLSLIVVGCNPDNGEEGTDISDVTSDVALPDGYEESDFWVGYFWTSSSVSEVKFSNFVNGELKITFRTDLQWDCKVLGGDGWLTVPLPQSSGSAGLCELVIVATDNKWGKIREATVTLMSGDVTILEISLAQLPHK